MKWFASWTARMKARDSLLPRFCDAPYFSPQAMREECDCVHVCKWGRGPGQGIRVSDGVEWRNEEEEESVVLTLDRERRVGNEPSS